MYHFYQLQTTVSSQNDRLLAYLRFGFYDLTHIVLVITHYSLKIIGKVPIYEVKIQEI